MKKIIITGASGILGNYLVKKYINEGNKVIGTTRSKNIKILWNDKIRIGKKFSKKKYEILKCINCDVGYLKDRQSFLEDNKIFRKIFDGDNSVLKYQSLKIDL